MEKQVIFRDYQEQQASDHNNLQGYVRGSLDDLVYDAVTGTLRYSGFNTVKSNQAEITVAPGRFYGKNTAGQPGAVFSLPTQTVQSLVSYLAASSQRIVTIVAYGVENQVDVQTRDFLTNVTTGQTEPQPVAMTSSRDAVLAVLQGAEGPDPQAPAIASTQVGIANVLLDTSGVVSVTMLPAGQVTSTEALDNRLSNVENFDNQIAPRVSALAADLAALANKLNESGQRTDVIKLYQDMAEVKAKVGLPSTFADYGADYFLWPDTTQSDTADTQSLGWNALVDMGVRFPAQNAAIFALSLFNPLDSNAAYQNGLLLPVYDNTLKLETGAFNTSIAMGQYGYQTYALVEKDIAYSRLRDGGSYAVCTNGVTWQTSAATGTPAWWLPNFSTYETVTVTDNGDPNHLIHYYQYWWHDSWTEPYWELDTINHSVNGAQLAQTFLCSSDMWVTKLGIYIQSVASATDVWLTLCQCTNGVPDLTKVISHQNIAGAALVQGWNELAITPSFASKGDRMGVLVTCAANHQIGMADGGSYLDGTFMYSTDGAYFLGDLTKEMMLRVYTAEFRAPQVTIELGALNLGGGIRDIDLTARMIVPASCDLIFEVLPDGTGTWLPITPDNPLVPFATAPVLARFRARFVGTPAVAPGIKLTDSICKIWCPANTFRHVSSSEVLPSSSTNITVRLLVEGFNPVAHTCTAKLHGNFALATGSVTLTSNPATGTTIVLNGTTVTFVTSGATGNQVNIGANLAATLTALATFLSASADAQIAKCTYSVTTTVLSITDKTGGAGGNSFTLVTTVSGATLSGATLTGGGVGYLSPIATASTLLDASIAQYQIDFTFTPAPGITTFTIVIDGTTNAVANTFHVAERVFWAL
jgi:hypothetical protein